MSAGVDPGSGEIPPRGSGGACESGGGLPRGEVGGAGGRAAGLDARSPQGQAPAGRCGPTAASILGPRRARERPFLVTPASPHFSFYLRPRGPARRASPPPPRPSGAPRGCGERGRGEGNSTGPRALGRTKKKKKQYGEFCIPFSQLTQKSMFPVFVLRD